MVSSTIRLEVRGTSPKDGEAERIDDPSKIYGSALILGNILPKEVHPFI